MSEGLKLAAVWRVGTEDVKGEVVERNDAFELFIGELCAGGVWFDCLFGTWTAKAIGQDDPKEFWDLPGAPKAVEAQVAEMISKMLPGVIVTFDRDALEEALRDE